MSKTLSAKSTPLQCLKILADRMRGKHLKNIGSMSQIIDDLMQKLSLTSQEQALAFTAVFDRHCGGRPSDIEDIASYYDCEPLEAMQLAPALREMLSKGLMQVVNNENRITQMRFDIDDEVTECILEGKTVKPRTSKMRKFNQYDLCIQVSSLIHDRDIPTKSLISRMEKLEKEHRSLALVKGLKALRLSVADRALFYEISHDLLTNEDCDTDIVRTLSDIFDNVLERTKTRRMLINGNHPLMKAELIEQVGENEMRLSDDGKKLLFGKDAAVYGVATEKLDRYAFVDKIFNIMRDTSKESKRRQYLLQRKVEKLEDYNKHLSFIGKLVGLDALSRFVFYITASAFTDGGSYRLDNLDNIYDKHKALIEKNKFKQETHPLMERGLVELTNDGFLNSTSIVLTEKGKEIFLEEDIDLFIDKPSSKDMILHDKVAEKKLFFDDELSGQLQMLGKSLEPENYNALRQRLKEKNMPQGIAALLYGEPGTGKTESVIQMARATGRDIMHVDISQTKSCWFGESEKIIKDVFKKYRRLCQKSELTPILLFNEADAVLSRRKDASSSNVAQTENAIQNIILEELENLDGILIATTNLATNLDRAFDRRFLFKIKFGKPALTAKKLIWQYKMPMLTPAQARSLATTYDFTGGEIDNIARKATMKELLEGTSITPATLDQFCKEERLQSAQGRKIGF